MFLTLQPYTKRLVFKEIKSSTDKTFIVVEAPGEHGLKTAIKGPFYFFFSTSPNTTPIDFNLGNKIPLHQIY